MVLLTIMLTVFSVCGRSNISDLSIATGPRGVAISLTADCSFVTHFEKTNGSEVSIFLKSCANETGSISYDQFKADAAVKKISLKSKNEGIELNISLRVPADPVIRSYAKGNSWFALLSSKPCAKSEWKLSDLKHEYKENYYGEVEGSSASLNSLRNIHLISRANICELFFDFNAIVKYSINRRKDTLIIGFENSASAIDSSSFILPQGTAFKRVILDKKITSSKHLLIARVILNSADTAMNILSKTGMGFSLYATLKDRQNAVLWNCSNGLELGYDFYKMPVYEIDMKQLEKQIQNDNTIAIADNMLFTVHQKQKPDTLAEVTTQMLEDAVQKKENPENDSYSSEITTMQQVQTGIPTGLQVNLGSSEVPVAMNGEIPKTEMIDSIAGESLKNLIRYNRSGRDPFLPYFSSVESDLGLPFLENLHLVGILFDDNDRIALLEDKKNQNRPFAMREEDRIENGKVLKIYKDKVVFLITEFGISRSVILRLTNTSQNQEVGIR